LVFNSIQFKVFFAAGGPDQQDRVAENMKKNMKEII